ncbi:MAG TPA: cobyric acid synthase, partial [Acidimicrobiia bacterium]
MIASSPPGLGAGLCGALMVCGTSSSAGKSTIVTGLCRLLARRGVRVAPFKAQNMSNNAAVCADGTEIGRAQYAQALAAGIDPSADLNPILLKPIDDRRAQVIVHGRPLTHAGAADYGTHAGTLLDVASTALERLRRRFDVVVAEGAGSPAELNLLERDVANLPLAARAGIDAVLVADVDRGGMLAAAYGTVALLPAELRGRVRGIVVNRFRGDAALLRPGLELLEARAGVPVLGVVPHLPGAVDAEDSLDVPASAEPRPAALVVAVVRTPRLSNFTDVEPLAAEPDVIVRYATRPEQLTGADVIVLAGSRAVTADLAWLRRAGLARAVTHADAVVLGICGGYQMLGGSVADPDGVEGPPGAVAGLGLLPVTTRFGRTKTTRVRRGRALGCTVEGYEIRHGEPVREGGESWVELDDELGVEHEGAVLAGRVFGTSLHGLFENDAFRRTFLGHVAARRRRSFVPGSQSFASVRARFHDRVADALEA